MPEIVPFKGILYGSRVVSEADRLICPPYDAIPAEVQRELYDASPYNAVRMELPMEPDPYSAAAERLRGWLAEGILVQDAAPALYPCSQTYVDAGGVERTRHGFFAALRLYDAAEGQVLPHEKTLSGPKADRLNMFRKTSANLSSIFGIYADESRSADKAVAEFCRTHEPVVDALFQGVRNRLWRMDDVELVGRVQQVLAGVKVYIADGHHRYETGVAYRNERRASDPGCTGNEPWNHILAYLSNIHDDGLVIQPIHRLVRGLDGFSREAFVSMLDRHFTVWELPGRKALTDFLAGCPACVSYGVVLPGMMLGVTLDSPPEEVLPDGVPEVLRKLPVVVLHELVFGRMLGITPEATAREAHLSYVKSEQEVFDSVGQGSAQIGIVMKPTRVQQVVEVSGAGEVMPQKSTWFYPKVMTGLVFRSLEGDA